MVLERVVWLRCIEGNNKGRGKPKLTLDAVVQKDLGVLSITEHDDLDRAL